MRSQNGSKTNCIKDSQKTLLSNKHKVIKQKNINKTIMLFDCRKIINLDFFTRKL